MTPEGLSRLKADEGLRLAAYPDPLTGAAPWTIGYGCTGTDAEGAAIGPETVWTAEKAQAELDRRVSRLEAQLTQALPWSTELSPVRRDVLANMAYNLGLRGLLGFAATLAAIKAGDYGRAADRMLHSAWARQVPARARRLAVTMRAGR